MLQATHQLEDADEKGSLPQAPDETTILINLEDDDATRGDTAGKRGIARALKRRLGGKARIVFATHAYIREQFPEIPDGVFDYDQALARYLAPLNPPQILLGNGANATSVRTGVRIDEMLQEGSINESISDYLLNENELVSHHLTPEILDEHGRLFDGMHPDIKHPVLAVMLVYGDSRSEREYVSKKIVGLMAHYPQATVYLCASRRTKDEDVDQLSQELNDAIQAKGLAGRLDVRAYKFSYNAGYNPYKGLIARARHFLVWGNSRSLVSEALYSGKTVYIYETGKKYQNQIEAGRIMELYDVDTSAPPPYGEYEPVDIADQIAEKLLKNWQDKKSEFERQQLDDIRIAWAGDQAFIPHVVAAMKDMRALAKMPRDVLENKEFAAYLVDRKPMTFRYFDAFWGDIDIAAKAYCKDAGNIDYLPEAMLADKEKILCLLGKSRHGKMVHRELFARVAPELWDDRSFVMAALGKAGAKIVMPLIGRKLEKDQDFFRDAVLGRYIRFSDLPEDMQKERPLFLQCLPVDVNLMAGYPHFANTREEALECLNSNPHVYDGLPEQWKNDDTVATKAVEDEIRNYARVPEKIRENLDFAVRALNYGGNRFATYIPQKLIDDKESYLKLVEADVGVACLRVSPHVQETEFAKALIDVNVLIFEYMLPHVKDNLDVIAYAISKRPEYWNSLDNETKKTHICLLACLKQHYAPAFSVDLPDELAKDDDVFWLYVENGKTHRIIAAHRDKLQDNETCLKIVGLDPLAYNLLPDEKKADATIALAAVKESEKVIAYLPEVLFGDRAFLKDLLMAAPDGFAHLAREQGPEFWSNEENRALLQAYCEEEKNIEKLPAGIFCHADVMRTVMAKTNGDAAGKIYACAKALADNGDLAFEMVGLYGHKVYRAMGYYLSAQNKKDILTTFIGKDVTQAAKWLDGNDYYSEDIMGAVLDLPDMRPEYLVFGGTRVDVVVRLKPEWVNEPAIRQALEANAKKPERVYITEVADRMMQQTFLQEQHDNYTMSPLSAGLKEAWGKKIGKYINETPIKLKDAKLLKNIKQIPLPKLSVF